MEIKRILWPTDLTEGSAQAMPIVTSQAEKYGATIVVLHVMDEVTRFDRVAKALNNDEAQRIREMIRTDADEALTKVCSMLGDSCPNFEKHAVEGDPSEEILKFIDTQNIDMVVMATHGDGAKRAYSQANVTREVVKHAGIPVLSVPIK